MQKKPKIQLFKKVLLRIILLFEITIFLCGCSSNFTHQLVLLKMHPQFNTIKQLINELVTRDDRITLYRRQQLTVGPKLTSK